jgi:hypothetical protein
MSPSGFLAHAPDRESVPAPDHARAGSEPDAAQAFPDILWGEDVRQAPKWSEDDGIIVRRRKSNPNEATVEAWGLVDGQPTSKHFRVLLYDDVVVAGSVTIPRDDREDDA